MSTYIKSEKKKKKASKIHILQTNSIIGFELLVKISLRIWSQLRLEVVGGLNSSSAMYSSKIRRDADSNYSIKFHFLTWNLTWYFQKH